MDNKYLFVGEDVSNLKIYEIINKYFNTNYAGWMKAWYDINEDFAAWFPTITETDERPNGIYGGRRNCSNTLSPDRSTIIEIDHDFNEPITDQNTKYDKYRFVFARINDCFVFLGIFKRTLYKDGDMVIKKHIKVADGINTKTFEMYKKI